VQLYTSRWQNKELADLDVQPVGISRGLPKWRLPYSYRTLQLLAPSGQAFGIDDSDEFERAYRAGLEDIGLEVILGALKSISGDSGERPLVLLCYEDVLPPPQGKGDLCHRRIAARWLEQKVPGLVVPELQRGALSPLQGEAQTPLF
jgi:hypothetical protein